MKQTVSYYKPWSAESPEPAPDLLVNDKLFHKVTETTTDEHLIDAVRLAKAYGGYPWRDGDGISPNTRYGIADHLLH